MEFRFDLNDIFQHPVVEVGNTLIPPGFSGDKRALWDTQSKVTQIVNAMGEASAQAQGLSKPITTADRLRNSEHRLYLLMDQTANNGKGAVTGMLKTGEKGLYVFDREGQHYQVSPPCVLDFYIHESRQRSGFGKQLFEHMLQKEQIEPVRMAIDRPSDKFLGFLNKHYGLNSPVKQMNNYVVFDGFFPRATEAARPVEPSDKSYTPSKKQSANGLQASFSSSPYGRYGAPRPTCSMGQIIHNDSAVIKRNQEPAGVRSEPFATVQGNNSYYGNQPAWQTTQSSPSVFYGYSQNQQMYNPTQMAYPPNQQYPQNQLQSVGSPAPAQFNQSTVPLPPNIAYQNYVMAQGDARHAFKQDNMNNPSQSYQAGQALPSYHAQQPNQIGQNSPQFMNPQNQQNYYYYNPQSQQYQTSPHQQVPHQPYNRRETMMARPTKTKEPLVPQHFDGTLRKMPHTVQSTPVQGEKQAQASAVVLQTSASAPVNYQQPSRYQQNMVQHDASQNTQMVGHAQTGQQMPFTQPVNNYPPSQSQVQQQDHNAVAQVSMSGQNPLLPQAKNINEASAQMAGQSQQSALPGASQPNAQVIQTSTQQQQQQQQQQQSGEQNRGMGQMIRQDQAITQQQQQQQIVEQNRGVGQFNNPNFNNAMAPQPVANNQIMQMPADQYQKVHQQVESIPQLAAGASSTIPSSVVQQNVQGNIQQYPIANHNMQDGHHQGPVGNQQHTVTNQQQNVTVPQQAVYSNQPEMVQGRVAQQGVAMEAHSVPNVNVGNVMEQEMRQIPHPQEIDLSKGYPPQHFEISAQNSTPKADRPNSLNIEPAEEAVEENMHEGEALGGENGEVNSLDGEALRAIEREIQKVEIAPKASTPLSRGSRSPGVEAAGIVTPGRSSPGLTNQGYFDLKFYHNKLW